MRFLGGRHDATASLRWSAAVLLLGGVILALLSGSLGLGALVFGFGAVLLGLAQVLAGRDRPGLAIGWVLVLAGLGTVVDGVIRLLTGA
jgi:hypothetical protein